MIVASGFIEVNSIEDIERIKKELDSKRVEVTDINGNKIVFLIEREMVSQIKESLESLKDVEGVQNVYLAYYSLEGADEVMEGE